MDVLAALALMTQRRIRHLPVVEGDAIRGIVSIGDLVKHRMDRIMWRHSIRNDAVVTEIPVTEIEFEHAVTPLLSRAIAEGVRVE